MTPGWRPEYANRISASSAPAEPAARPYTPNLPLNLAIGALGGFVLAIGYVMLRSRTRRPYSRPARPELPGTAGTRRHTATTVVEALCISFLPIRRRKAPIERAVLEQRSSYLSESFRTTLTSILSAPVIAGIPKPGFHEFTADGRQDHRRQQSRFALAEAGRQTLVIDGDMRRPQLHRTFDQANAWGLSDVLREWNSIEDIPLKAMVKKTAVPNLCLLPGGTPTDHIPGLLHSGRMSKLLARFREEFDYVLVDAPPAWSLPMRGILPGTPTGWCW